VRPRRSLLPALLLGLAVVVALVLASSRVRARASLLAVTPRTGAVVWVSPPEVAPAEARPRIGFLHGMCMDAHRTCDRVRDLVEPHGALACPTGNGACGASADWRGEGEEKAAHVEAALGAAWSHVGAASSSGDVLVGFSRGAFVARDVAYARPGAFKSLVLLGAALSPDPDRLRASGVRRVVLGCGDFDPARSTMVKAARDLEGQGIEARFVSLGPVGHALPRDVAARLGAHLGWAAEG
jgi:predicted esterase